LLQAVGKGRKKKGEPMWQVDAVGIHHRFEITQKKESFDSRFREKLSDICAPYCYLYIAGIQQRHYDYSLALHTLANAKQAID
jgi:hypothetical protein